MSSPLSGRRSVLGAIGVLFALLGGGLLAYARHRTGSSLAGVAPHIAGNLKVLAMIAWT